MGRFDPQVPQDLPTRPKGRHGATDALRTGRGGSSWSVFARLHLLEVLTALSALFLACWHLLKADARYFGGFAVFWVAPPLVALAVHVRAPRLPFFRAWSGVYLALLCVGALVASRPDWLPHFQALHPASTEFAQRWNRLGPESRRMFSWNMALGGASMFYLCGIWFWDNLRRRRRYGRSELSPGTCVLGLLAVWFLPGLGLLYFILSLFVPGR